LDMYRDLPKDMTEQTLTGGFVSVACATFIAYLFLTELITFLTPEVSTDMYVDAHQDTGKEQSMIHINLNMTLPKMPCAVTSVDAQDIMGTHVVDVGGQLHKVRLDEQGRPKRDSRGALLSAESSNPQEQIGEGCEVSGYLIVNKVPGNFHISAHSHAHLVHVFFGSKPMNVSHVINHLSFGNFEETTQLKDVAGAHINPLKGTRKMAEQDPNDSQNAKSYEYYIKIVPTVYDKLNGKQYRSFQFVADSNEVSGRYQLPAAYFRYDLSPITVHFTEKRRSFAHFLVQICAIIGGVFTVLGLVNSFLNTSLHMMRKKAQEGKLG